MTKPRFSFSISATDAKARAGTIQMRRGDIRTPAFMPVGTAATVKAMTLPDVKERLDTLGYIARVGSPEEYANFVQSEVDKWRRVVKSANVRVD
mgnify:CR=1 FL=1